MVSQHCIFTPLYLLIYPSDTKSVSSIDLSALKYVVVIGRCTGTNKKSNGHVMSVDLEQGEQRFLLESNTEVQRKLGHHKAGSCFPHISSSVLWILVKLGTYGKLFSRGIQRHQLREIWRRTRRGRRVLPEINSAV